LWTFQWLRWCSREQYHAVPHAVHFLVTDSAEQDGNQQRREVIEIEIDGGYRPVIGLYNEMVFM
jgi:hypothetical protein